LTRLGAGGNHHVFGFEAGIDVDAQLALRQVPDMTHGGDDLVVAPQILVNRLRLRRRLDDD
jgi:hypothetical protein